jgi:hypothetical protein
MCNLRGAGPNYLLFDPCSRFECRLNVPGYSKGLGVRLRPPRQRQQNRTTMITTVFATDDPPQDGEASHPRKANNSSTTVTTRIPSACQLCSRW